MTVNKIDAHLTHCCLLHGCKYGSLDCPVYWGTEKQAFPCEICDEKESATMDSVLVEKSVVTTVTMVLSGDKAKDLEEWLMWSFQVWKQIQQHPNLKDEIFYPETVETPKTIDSVIIIRNGLRDA